SQTFTVAIKFASVVEMEALHEYVTTGEGDFPSVAMNVLQLALAERPNLLFTSFHKSTHWGFYDAYNPQFNISDGLNLGQGWKQSVKATLGELLLNVDISNTAFYPAEPLLALIPRVFNKRDIRDINPRDLSFGSISFTRLGKFLKNVAVTTTHISRKYKIRGLSKQTAATAMIDLFDSPGQKCSVQQYFRKAYNLEIRYPDLPLVICSEDSKILVPIEFLEVKKGQRYMGKLSDIQTSDVIKMTAMKPTVRMKKIDDGRTKLHEKDTRRDPFLAECGVDVDDRMIEVNARVLNVPTVTGAQGATLGVRDGSMDYLHARNFHFYRGAPLTKWSVAVFGDERRVPENAMGRLFDEIRRECTKLGIGMAQRDLREVTVHKSRMSVEETLKRAVEVACAADGAGGVRGVPLQALEVMVFCVMVGKSAMYDEIKYITETTGRVNCMTQCILSDKHFGNKGIPRGAGTNFALKINAKCGGSNTIVEPGQFLGKMGDGLPTMVMGADVTHPPAGKFGGASIAAVVASMDDKFVDFRAVESAQAPKVEIIGSLQSMAVELFTQFAVRNKAIPKRVLFFRDGVSDGQFQEVSLQEVNALKKALHQVGAGDCKLTFVIVSKRHAHRFFVTNPSDGDKNGNVRAGTVIDSGVTHPAEFDFYLYSHAGIQGTSRPTHYQVLLDETMFGADELQEICFAMCHTYARANKSVSVVPAVYYANLAADRARYHREGGVNGGSESGMSGELIGDDAAAIAEFQTVTRAMKETMYYV
ncbi:eukaryotic translation initiation factor 2C, 2, partial [Podochytrium sp. JEL0797]